MLVLKHLKKYVARIGESSSVCGFLIFQKIKSPSQNMLIINDIDKRIEMYTHVYVPIDYKYVVIDIVCTLVVLKLPNLLLSFAMGNHSGGIVESYFINKSTGGQKKHFATSVNARYLHMRILNM